jgi:hypothetical protein
MAHQSGVVQAEGLVKELRVIAVPAGHGRVEGIKNHLNLNVTGRIQEATVLVVKVNLMPRAHPHLMDLSAGVNPEFLTPNYGRIEGPLANPFWASSQSLKGPPGSLYRRVEIILRIPAN